MGSVSLESASGSDQQSEERCGSYSLRPDVSKFEISSTFSCGRFDVEAMSTSMASSSRARSIFTLVSGKDAVVWEEIPQKLQTDLSDNYP